MLFFVVYSHCEKVIFFAPIKGDLVSIGPKSGDKINEKWMNLLHPFFSFKIILKIIFDFFSSPALVEGLHFYQFLIGRSFGEQFLVFSLFHDLVPFASPQFDRHFEWWKACGRSQWKSVLHHVLQCLLYQPFTFCI